MQDSVHHKCQAVQTLRLQDFVLQLLLSRVHGLQLFNFPIMFKTLRTAVEGFTKASQHVGDG